MGPFTLLRRCELKSAEEMKAPAPRAAELEDLRAAMIRANDVARLRPRDAVLERRARAATAAYEAALRRALDNPPLQES